MGEHEATFADVCFCNEDKCNKDVPVMPDPDVPTDAPGPDNTTPCPECVKCYSCGFMKEGDSETHQMGDIPFCNDFANPDENVANCGKDDCCGMCKEYGESCWQVDDAQLDPDHGQGNVTIIEAEICLCGRDRCNNADPVPEVPTTTTGAPGSASTQATLAWLLLISPILLL